MLVFLVAGLAAANAADNSAAGETHGFEGADGLLRWAKENGADTDHVELVQDGDGMALVAKRDFAAGALRCGKGRVLLCVFLSNCLFLFVSSKPTCAICTMASDLPEYGPAATSRILFNQDPSQKGRAKLRETDARSCNEQMR